MNPVTGGAVDLQAVIETQAAINATDPSLTEVMQIVVERAQALTGGDGAVVELAEGDEMVYRAVSGSASGSLGLRLRLHGSLSGLCVSTGQVLGCQDTEQDPRVDLDSCRRVGVRSMVVAPLVHRGRTVGALKVLSSTPHGFDVGAADTVRLLAGFIAASLSHARRFEELSRLNEALDDFSAHVAHDLHNPIAVVRMTGSVLRRVLGDDHPEASQLVSVIEERAGHTAELVSNLLVLARAGRTPSRRAFDLGRTVDEAARGLDGIALDNQCADVTLFADPIAVHQAVANLLSNGARHAAVEGTAAMTVRCESSPEGWRVLVADRGPGVDDDDRRRVFAAFERGGRAATVEGSGLGLAIVAAMADAHSGEAGHEPRSGGGSVFWFSLRREGEGHDVVAPRQGASSHRRARGLEAATGIEPVYRALQALA